MNILKASSDLVRAVKTAGRRERFAVGDRLFECEDKNNGVFLVLTGKVCMSVTGMPALDRTFSAGSLLGLPATFTGNPYSLTAIASCDCEVVHASREDFLRLMCDRLELCREATDMLCRETAFIESALAEQRRCAMAG
jgi:CRP-like cAMP-binding protein